MSSVCAEQHKFQVQPSQQLLSLKKSLRDIDIPPRKLLTRRAAAATHDGADMFSDETLLQKYLPHNNMLQDSDDDSDPYSSDHFRMYEFKVRRCTRSRSHDWTDCPFAHPGEKARRRDPRRYHYSSTICPEYRRGGGSCSRGDACEFSHGVFECWLHPAKYRTEACKDGKNCKRKVCFFAHTPRQLRVLPVNSHTCSNDLSVISCSNNNKGKFLNPSNSHCCLFCHCCGSGSGATCSPTSTLFGMSHFSSSPPMSPSSSPASPAAANGVSVSPLSRFVGSETSCAGIKHHYKDVLTELMFSLEGLNIGEANSPLPSASSKNLSWIDSSNFNCEDQQQPFVVSPSSVAAAFGVEDHQQQQQQQFILSPTITSRGSASFSNARYSSSKLSRNEGKDPDDVSQAPDLGWVNDLLM